MKDWELRSGTTTKDIFPQQTNLSKKKNGGTDHPMDQNVFAYVFGSLRRGAMCLPVICDCGIY